MSSYPGVSSTASAAFAPSSRRVTTLVLLCLGHFSIDLYSSAIGAFQPMLVSRFALTLAQAGVLGGILVFSSSVMQPVYGYLSDRFRSKIFAALSPAVAGIFISSLGLAPGYPWLLAMVALGGAGIAAFHPQASARTGALARAGRGGQWMAVFISAGSLGMAIGPSFFSAVAIGLGLEKTYWAAIPGILVTALLMKVLPPSAPAAAARPAGFDWRALRSVARPLTILYFLVFIRSIVQITYAQFLPLYLTRERGFGLREASYALTLYLTCGAIGGFIGGRLSDRFGGRNVILASMAGCVPFLLLFFLTRGVLAYLGLALGGFMLLFTIPVNVVMAQELVPSQSGTVSALMMGFSWGTAGIIFIPLTGIVSDALSLHHTLAALALFPIFGFLLTLKLPKEL